MSLDAVKILEISVTINSKKEILEYFQKSLITGAKKTKKIGKNASFAKKIVIVVTPNPEQIVYAQIDSHFRDFLNRADVSLPDGVGVVWASRVLASMRQSVNASMINTTIPGVECMEDLVRIAAEQHVPVVLIGGRDGLALRTFDCLSKLHPGLRGWAVDGPEAEVHACLPARQGSQLTVHSQNTNTDEYFQELAQRIVDSGVRMVFVGLGAPKQEYFIERLSQIVNRDSRFEKQKNTTSPESRVPSPVIFMSVGGSFDEISGRISRAPRWVSKLGLKWLWRLILEPWRIKRQLALITFVWLVMKEKYRLK
jgi:N-acetylglucosaminyldiphosphoundecaprenol N-acetyl-beta-D-mannosaminyltransferase